jgi:hypothetical protein
VHRPIKQRGATYLQFATQTSKKVTVQKMIFHGFASIKDNGISNMMKMFVGLKTLIHATV